MRRTALFLGSLGSLSCFACAADPIGGIPSSILVDPRSIALGDTPVGVLKKHQVKIANEGIVKLEVEAIALAEEEGVPFSLDLSAAPAKDLPFTLAPGEDTIVEIRHIPRDRILDSGVLRVRSDDPDQTTIEVAIEQLGVGQPHILAVPDVEQADAEADTPGGISSSVQTIAFGAVPIGVLRTQTVFVVNGGDGNVPLEITGIALADEVSAENLAVEVHPDPADSAVLLPLLGVKSRASPIRSVEVRLSWQPPASGGDLDAKLRISSSDPARPALDIPITGSSGTSHQTPMLILTPETGLVFSATTLGDHADENFTAFNAGDADLTIAPLSITGDVDHAFSLLEMSTAVTIAPGRSHVFEVRFTPTRIGDQNASIRLTTNDPGRLTTDYTLSGRAGMAVSCTPAIPDPGEPANDTCGTASDRGAFALDVNMQQNADWNDAMLYPAAERDWSALTISAAAGCDFTGYDFDANVTLPSGEHAEVCLQVGDCGSPLHSICGTNTTSLFLSPFTSGPDACAMYNNNLPVQISVRHTGGDLTCTSYTLHFSAR